MSVVTPLRTHYLLIYIAVCVHHCNQLVLLWYANGFVIALVSYLIVGAIPLLCLSKTLLR